MPVPKRRKSRANIHARRSQWKAESVSLTKSTESGRTVYSLPHRAKSVTDSAGTELFMEYKGRRVADS
jgi:large subunit ribosomal protein L32